MERTEVAEIEALRSMFAAVPSDLAAELGTAALDLGAGLAVKTSALSAAPELNHALGVASADQLDKVVRFFRGVQHIVSPAPGLDLDNVLRERGYEPGYAWMKFSRGLDDLPEPRTDLELVEVGSNRGADFGRGVTLGYGLPERLGDWLAHLPGRDGWHCFAAYDGSEPVAAGALHVHGQVGWIGIGSTVPSHRGRGAQSSILAARIRRAAELGCTLLVTETGEHVPDRPSSSYRNILRAGFEPRYLRANWASAVDIFEPDVGKWGPWRPQDVAGRFEGVEAPWCVAAGWAIDLFLGEETREHEDIEVAVPRHRFGELADRLADHELFVAGNGVVRPLATAAALLDSHHQTWVREPATGSWRLDVFREPAEGDTWIYRRDDRIRMPYAELIERTVDGIPYMRPEVVLLFKARHADLPKNEHDLTATLPRLAAPRRRWLADGLAVVHPGHRWVDLLR